MFDRAIDIYYSHFRKKNFLTESNLCYNKYYICSIRSIQTKEQYIIMLCKKVTIYG
jgi:hypothetical protein